MFVWWSLCIKKSKAKGGAYSITACYGILDKNKRVETSKAISKRYI
ncbi:hypothetical protein Goari_024888, partial [Gossypium aridum]|nr:hypothetical protein [Gossypium aridum]